LDVPPMTVAILVNAPRNFAMSLDHAILSPAAGR
jgi:hypothetical protein